MKLKLNGVTYNRGKINGDFIGDFHLTDYMIINNNSNRNLTYYYANDEDVLSDYEEIAYIKANGSYTYFNSLNVTPSDATRVVGVDISNTIQDEAVIPNNLKCNLGTKLYSVGLLSDIHIDGNGDGDNTDSGESQNDFINALQFFNNKNVDFICIDGDVTYYGYDADYEAYKSIVTNYSNNIPIKAIRGNHECYANGDSNYDNTNTKFQDNIDELYYEYVHENGDVYLFVGMYNESKSTPFSTEELEWLSNKLETYKNQRVFLFVHYYYGDVGNVNGISNHGQITNQTFIDLVTNYKNVIYFSGHTHLAFYLQQYGKDANIKKAGDICHRVHIPSCAKPRTTEDGTTGSYINYFAGSEGYLMEVYEKGILLKGINFETNKYLPIATYFLETIPTIVPDDTLTNEQINAINNMNFTMDKDLFVEYDDEVLDVEFNIENNNLIVTNNVTGLDFSINENGEMEVDY